MLMLGHPDMMLPVARNERYKRMLDGNNIAVAKRAEVIPELEMSVKDMLLDLKDTKTVFQEWQWREFTEGKVRETLSIMRLKSVNRRSTDT